MHSKSNNKEIKIGNETDKIVNELFRSHLTRYQLDLGESMKSRNFVLDNIDGMYYTYNKYKSLKIVYRFP